jgi:hypothetical protein
MGRRTAMSGELPRRSHLGPDLEQCLPPTPFEQLSDRQKTHLEEIVRGEREILASCSLCNGLGKHGWLVYRGDGVWLPLDPQDQGHA